VFPRNGEFLWLTTVALCDTFLFMSQAYCTSCGSPIPDGQGKSCSMCYGDPYYGRGGYALKMLEEQAQQEYEGQVEREDHSRMTDDF